MKTDKPAQNGAELDLQQLKALALAAKADSTWPFNVNVFRKHLTPAVVLDLIARIERATAPRAAQWNLTDARESLARAQAFTGFNDLPQPLRVEIDNAASILAKLDAAPHGSAAPAEPSGISGELTQRAAAPVSSGERELFETDLRRKVQEAGGSPDPQVYATQLLQRDGNGYYKTDWVESKWEGWSDRAAVSASQAAPVQGKDK